MAGSLRTNNGKALVTNLVGGSGANQPAYVGIGSGTSGPAAGDTQLGTEFTTSTWAGYARAHVVPTRGMSPGGVANDTLTWTALWTAPGSVTVAELGIFDSATPAGSTLYLRSVFTGYALNNGDQLQLSIAEQQT